MLRAKIIILFYYLSFFLLELQEGSDAELSQRFQQCQCAAPSCWVVSGSERRVKVEKEECRSGGRVMLTAQGVTRAVAGQCLAFRVQSSPGAAGREALLLCCSPG